MTLHIYSLPLLVLLFDEVAVVAIDHHLRGFRQSLQLAQHNSHGGQPGPKQPRPISDKRYSCRGKRTNVSTCGIRARDVLYYSDPSRPRTLGTTVRNSQATQGGIIVLQEEFDQSRQAKALTGEIVWIPGGTFHMGSHQHYSEEAPSHGVVVEGFWRSAGHENNENKSCCIPQNPRGGTEWAVATGRRRGMQKLSIPPPATLVSDASLEMGVSHEQER